MKGPSRPDGAGKTFKESENRLYLLLRVTEYDTATRSWNCRKETEAIVPLKDKFEIMVSLRGDSKVEALQYHDLSVS